jgi:hypothetical protein
MARVQTFKALRSKSLSPGEVDQLDPADVRVIKRWREEGKLSEEPEAGLYVLQIQPPTRAGAPVNFLLCALQTEGEGGRTQPLEVAAGPPTLASLAPVPALAADDHQLLRFTQSRIRRWCDESSGRSRTCRCAPCGRSRPGRR